MVDLLNLAERTVIVTGAAQGIGAGIAKMASELGARLALVDMNADLLETVRESLPGPCKVFAGSVSDPDFVEAMVEETAQTFGPIHGLVNNAGIIRPAMIAKMTLQQWRDVIDINLTGAFIVLQAVGRHMLGHVSGETGASIVNISSDAGRRGTIGQINYAAAKAGILGVTMSAAREWAADNIRVNTLCFGAVETPMTEVMRSDRFRDKLLAQIPMGRVAQTGEAASAACFLLSDAASYITGQHIGVNGGFHIAT
ncbi:MAG: SDR family oxidoreductase [Sphingomonas sp.]|nr:SDR family oxidoreductase [Sphingomonas sp.]